MKTDIAIMSKAFMKLKTLRALLCCSLLKVADLQAMLCELHIPFDRAIQPSRNLKEELQILKIV